MQMRKFILDERSKKKLEETATVVLALFYIVCPIEMLIKIITTHDFSSALGEVIILLSITATFPTVHRLDKNYSPTLPRKNNGEQLSSEKTRRSKLKTMLVYAKESIITAIGFRTVWVVMDYFLKKQSIICYLSFFINQLINIIIIFIVFFTIDAILKERKIKKFNKCNEKLDK